MKLLAIILIILACVSEAMFFIQRDHRKIKGFGAVFFKCFATFCAVILASVAAIKYGEPFRYLILAGVFISALADGIIEWKFIAGMFAFLVAHIFYIIAFAPGFTVASVYIYIVLIVLVAAAMRIMRPLGELHVPGIIYAFVISAMVALAVPASFDGSARGIVQAVGAVLFLISDAWLLTHIRYGCKPVQEVFSLGIYYASQFLIAMVTVIQV